VSLLALLDELALRGVELRLEAGRLRYRAPEGALTPELRERIALRRDELVASLARERKQEPDTLVLTPSSVQERLWFLNELQGPNPTYNIAFFLRLQGELSPNTLRESLEDVVRRHQCLRACLVRREEGLALEIHREVALPWAECSLEHAGDQELGTELRRFSDHCFDLSQAPLLRALLIRQSATLHVLAILVHHSMVDGWSVGLLGSDLAEAYRARLAGGVAPVPRPWQFSDFLDWQKELDARGVLESDLSFWREELRDAPPCTTLPGVRRRPAVQVFSGSSTSFALDTETAAGLRALARRWGASLNHVTLAVTALLISGLGGSKDLVLGMPLANRPRREFEEMVGMLVNVVPLRIRIKEEETVAGFVSRLVEVVARAMRHSNLPFEKLLGKLAAPRELGLPPVFQIAYNFLPRLRSQLDFGPLQAELVDSVHEEGGISKYDCTLYLDDREDGLTGTFEFADSLFDAETARRWCRLYQTLLSALVETPNASVSHLLAFAQQDSGSVYSRLQGPRQAVPQSAPWTLFEERAKLHPETLAVEEADYRLPWGALLDKAARLSALLSRRGVRHGDRVGLVLPRGVELVAAMLAVVRLGAVFLPLDPGHPPARLSSLIERAKLKAFLCPKGRRPGLEVATPLIELDEAQENSTECPPASPHAPTDPLYMIYTSGSTGRPKAAVLPCSGLLNMAGFLISTFGFGTGDRLSQINSPGFDASLFEIWSCLLSGATLVFVPEEERLDPVLLRDWLHRKHISFCLAPTPVGEALLSLEWRKDTALRVLAVGGQALRKWPSTALPFELWNFYGPTEASVTCTCCRVPPHAEPPQGLPEIGRALANTELAILDTEGQLVPVGSEGELYVGGVCVGLGYFDDPEATRASFVTLESHPGKRWYRTGDFVRLSPESGLEFLGRRDGQIKLRGHRIETGEVESALLRLQGVTQAVVRAERDVLVAYVETGGAALHASELRDLLSLSLPSYMVPSRFVLLDKLPRLSSGKIDLKALPCAQSDIPSASGTAQDETITAGEGGLLAGITRAWAEVLSVASPGTNDNFFDLGGHSLLLVRLKEQILAQTGRALGVLDLFRNPTIARQAAFLQQREQKVAPPARRPAPARPASFADEGIAIIGMSGRFPEADDVQAFWDNLRQGRDSIRFFTREELLAAGNPAELVDRPDYVPANAILENHDRFDAGFFGVPSREAEVMDPGHRLLLEEAWHAFEDAGLDPAAIEGRVGVFVGASTSGYATEHVLPRRDLVESMGGFSLFLGSEKDFAATRLSYKLGLHGPSLSINTACSTSLVAIHQALTALRDGQCELALAGGSCVRALQVDGYRYELGGILSKDGKCRAFDAEASGMVGGNGVALVLLKPLSAALRDGDPVRAVIRGSAINNDGSDKVGFTAPGLNGQSRVIQDALARANVDPSTVTYVEAHGTGTRLGDSIEVAALAENYAPGSSRETPLYLGSVKTNIGHLDAAAGAAGLIKTALCLEHRVLVPSVHFKTPNPEIHWPGDSFKVCTQNVPWPNGDHPLRAGVSSLGIGGTNAHVILEEAPASPSTPPAGDSPRLLLISGRSERALRDNASRIARFLSDNPQANLGDVAHTLAFGRRAFERRSALCVASPSDARDALKELPPAPGMAGELAFLFTGMGSEYPGMGTALHSRSPVFAAVIADCATVLQPLLGLDIRSLLLADPSDPVAAASLASHRLGQPVVFAFEYALARFWLDLGLRPSLLTGHSLGEWVAACVAGVFSLPDALRLVSLRGALMERQEKGAMLAVNLSEQEVVRRLPPGLDLASLNAPDQTVVAGRRDAIEAFASALEAEGVRCKRLQVALAAHSSLMEPALPELRAAFQGVVLAAPDPSMKLISNLTGRCLEPDELRSPDYWCRHLRGCVRFSDSLATLWTHPSVALLECGPAHTLCNVALRDARRPESALVLASMDGPPSTERVEWARILQSAGLLWSAGLPINLARLFELQGPGRRISLPGYAFERSRYWLDAVSSTASLAQAPTFLPPTETSRPELPQEKGDAPNPLEKRIIDLMLELLGRARLGPHSDFFRHGGDSLLAVRLASRISSAFSVQMPPSSILTHRTPAKLALLLGEGGMEVSTQSQPVSACLLRLVKGDPRHPPLVLIHAVGGGALIYQDLLRALSVPNPVYGLQAPGLWDGEPLHDLKQQASLYHSCLLQAGINAPALLGGSSYGGIVAYEMDRLFRQQGHRTPVVALMDSPGPGHLPAEINEEAEFFAYVLTLQGLTSSYEEACQEFRKLDRETSLARMRDLLFGTGGNGFSADGIERLTRLFHANLANLRAWTPSGHDTRLLYFKAREASPLLAANPELAWVPLASEGIEIIPIPGNHSTMLDGANAALLASVLNRRLSAAFNSP